MEIKVLKISKKDFKRLYFELAHITNSLGWTKDYWDKFYERETGKQYFFTVPPAPQDNYQVCIDQDKNTRRIYLLQEEGGQL